MQQTKQRRRVCAGGAEDRHGAAAKQTGSLASQNGGVTATGTSRSAGNIPGLPPGGFHTILADPPWPAQGGERHYQTMSLERIMGLPVGQLAASDAHLWLWTTNALLPRAYEVARAWGFTVRSPLTWVKFRLGLSGPSQLRNATEHLLFCTRGRAPLGSRSQPTWFNAPVAEHSRKPAEQFAIIERVSPGPYLELFARRQPESRADWAVWGDEVASDVQLPGYPVPRYSRPDDSPSGEAQVCKADAEPEPATAGGLRPEVLEERS